MRAVARPALYFLTVFLINAACAGSGVPAGSGLSANDVARAGPKRITAAIMEEPRGVNRTINLDAGAGTDAVEDLLHAGLANVDDRSRPRAQLAEALPTMENGQWRVLPNGRMETTWRLNSRAVWHDGTPFTSDDLVFTGQVGRDSELPIRRLPVFEAIDAIDASDPHTVTVRWNRPFIYADTLFTRTVAPPMPKHLLEKMYVGDKAAFAQLPYWNEEFVGAGPYKLRQWVRDSHIILEANDRYVLGRPSIDEIEIRIVGDQNALAGAILAGAVELTLGRSLTLDPAIQVRNQWQEGKMEVGLDNWFVMYPQLLTPSPEVVGDLDFRRALLHAIDRQQITDVLQAGLAPVAHTRIAPGQSESPAVERAVVRYEYDPAKAIQMIEGLGYARGPDGFFFRAGARLSVQIRTGDNDDLSQKAMFSIADAWKRIGVDTETFLVPRQLDEPEFAATFPALRIVRQPNDPASLEDFRGSQAPTPENRFRGRNRPRYLNAEFDALLDRYFATLSLDQRTQTLAEIERHISDRLIMMGLFYNTEPILIGNRLLNVTARGSGSTHAWNAEEWNLR